MDVKFDLEQLFDSCKQRELYHRYITNNHIEPLLKKLGLGYHIEVIGQSVNKLPIYGVKIGRGSKKILMWSQMHGNESTTTKALFDLFNFLQSDTAHFLEKCTLFIIPILNPDGALTYNRNNANNIDLNRDAQDLSQPESKVLRQVFDKYRPDFCFNLHGQRTIFSAGSSENPAVVSFLAPSQDNDCTVTENRKKAMEVVVAMSNMLQLIIPSKVGIYDDAFNINCVGDTFQSKNVPTILFEAGHYNCDYSREEVRKYIFMSIVVAIDKISNNDKELGLGRNYLPYYNIPKNEKRYFDIIIRNAKINETQNERILDIAIQFEEILVDNKVCFYPKVKKIGNLGEFYAHNTIKAKKQFIEFPKNKPLKMGDEIDFVKINNKLFSLKLTEK